MYYVYLLQSTRDGSTYVGCTENVKSRLAEHNNGKATYSRSKRPFKLKWFCSFSEKIKALAFEKYLKQGSGHAFAKKHLL
jgi:predicted GIY-YIG superfamily endonuclease